MKRPFRRLAAFTVAALLPVALMLGGGPASGSASHTKPTVVLVHGGWADSSGWNDEISRLQEAGYPVIAPANPLRGLSSDAAYVRSVLQTITGPVVLVGHSYGGAVITNAAVGAPNVKALVYIAAFAPDSGESLAQLVTKNPGTKITPDALLERPYPLPGGGTGTDLYIKESVFREAFAGDLPSRTTRLMQATQRPFSVAAFTEASAAPAWKSVPSWYLVATKDNAIPPATQRFMAQRARATTADVAASHVPMMSRPAETTALILKAARSVR
ncbi:alpha/beta fold hydrolase [Lentzea sp. CA-135723]|uniref:alpha/beta fold hydrolase n=1 Tax=Lentzea sp. CA-135723 TaxID=3239950 RepID=UPI003D8BA0B7